MTTIASDRSLLCGAVTHDIIGAFYEVYNELGAGFIESVYANALPIALADRGLCVEREKRLTVRFRGAVVGQFRVDLIVEQQVLVELKAADQLVNAHESQLTNYLKAADLCVGLLLNFGPKASLRRVIYGGNDRDTKGDRADPNADKAGTPD